MLKLLGSLATRKRGRKIENFPLIHSKQQLFFFIQFLCIRFFFLNIQLKYSKHPRFVYVQRVVREDVCDAAPWKSVRTNILPFSGYYSKYIQCIYIWKWTRVSSIFRNSLERAAVIHSYSSFITPIIYLYYENEHRQRKGLTCRRYTYITGGRDVHVR